MLNKFFLTCVLMLTMVIAEGAEMELKTYTLKNKNGMWLEVINYGGIITKMLVPDRQGRLADVVLGFDSPEDYVGNEASPYFGALIGRYGNRIANGRFTLNGVEYKLATNNGPNHLHGGKKGFDKVFWDVKQVNPQSLLLSYTSADGEEGYPGKLEVTVMYTLTDENALEIVYGARTDKPTPVNLTQHSYFNLTGDKSQTILDHVLTLKAEKYTVVDKNLTPTGELRSVATGPMDFRAAKRIAKDIKKVTEGGGFDHNWVLLGEAGKMKLAATLFDPFSGRYMEVHTTEPGIQFYSGNFLDGTLKGKNGDNYKKHDGLCLETQHFPDSPNHPAFPSTILKPGENLESKTIYKFSVKK